MSKLNFILIFLNAACCLISTWLPNKFFLWSTLIIGIISIVVAIINRKVK